MKLHLPMALLKVQFLLAAAIVMAQVLGKETLVSILFAGTFPVTVGLWLTAEKGFSEADKLAVSLLLLSCLSVAGNTLASGAGLSLSCLKKLLIFWTTVLFFSGAARISPEENNVDFFLRGNGLLALFLLGIYLLRGEQMYVWQGKRSQYLTFGFTNPNLAAVFLASVCILEWIAWGWSRRRLEKAGHGCLGLVMGWFVWKTQARNAQLLLLFFLAAGLLPELLGSRGKRLPDWACLLVGIFPLLFALCYLGVVQSPWVQRWFGFWISEGKALDSRTQIWLFAWKQFCGSPLLGNYSRLSGNFGVLQMHNSHLDVLVSYGTPVLLVLWMFLTQLLKGGKPRGQLCQRGFAALLLSGMGEAMLFSGGLGIYIFAGILRMLANYDGNRGERT